MKPKPWAPAGAALAAAVVAARRRGAQVHRSLLGRAGAARPVMRKAWVLPGAALAAAVLAALAIIARPSASGSSNPASGDPAATATVARGRLALQVSGTGNLTYAAQADGSRYPVVNQATGVLTALPSVGDVIRCGQVLYRVQGHPVPLFCGSTPLYRSLSEGLKGWDVK
jgi:hypothetical protein